VVSSSMSARACAKRSRRRASKPPSGAPGGVGVGVPLAEGPALLQVPLPVRVGREVGGVDSHVHAVLGNLSVQSRDDGVEAVRERVALAVAAKTLERARQRGIGREL